MYRLSPNIRLREAREYGITNDAMSDQKACNFEYKKGICKKCQQYFEVTNHDFRLNIVGVQSWQTAHLPTLKF